MLLAFLNLTPQNWMVLAVIASFVVLFLVIRRVVFTFGDWLNRRDD